MRKIFRVFYIAILIAAMSVWLCAVSFAAEYSADYADLSDYFTNTKDWNCKDGKMSVSNNTAKIKKNSGNCITNTKRTFSNEILHFVVSSDLAEIDNGNFMFMLRSKKTTGAPWGDDANDCILFVIKNNQIELQTFENGTGGILACVESPIEKWDKVDVVMGAVNIGDKITAFLSLNGETVICKSNVIFSHSEGYFDVLCDNIEFSLPKENTALCMPINIEVNAGIDSLAADVKYDMLNIGEKEPQTFSEIWYTSDENISKLNISAVSEKPIEELIQKREQSEPEIINEDDDGKYLVASLSDGNNVYYSNTYYIDFTRFIVGKGIFMLNNWYIGTVNGTQKMIDENSVFISPIFDKDNVFIPIRFVAENLGGKVTWDEEAKKACVELNGMKFNFADNANKDNDVMIITQKGRMFAETDAFAKLYNIDYFINQDYGIVVIGNEENISDEKILSQLQKIIKYGL